MNEQDYIRVRNLTNISRSLDALRDVMADDVTTESVRSDVISKLARLQQKYYETINNKIEE